MARYCSLVISELRPRGEKSIRCLRGVFGEQVSPTKLPVGFSALKTFSYALNLLFPVVEDHVGNDQIIILLHSEAWSDRDSGCPGADYTGRLLETNPETVDSPVKAPQKHRVTCKRFHLERQQPGCLAVINLFVKLSFALPSAVSGHRLSSFELPR